MEKKILNRGVLVLLALFFMSLTVNLVAHEKKNPEKTAQDSQMSSQGFDMRKAISNGDHKALADYYRAQAKAERDVADMHDKMREDYKNSYAHYKGSENAMATHCSNLKIKALDMAAEYEKLAREEEKMAKQK